MIDEERCDCLIKKLNEMTEGDKAITFDYAVYELEELIKCEITDIDDKWRDNPNSAYRRARLNTYKETLYGLTKDEKWMLSLEELLEVIFENDTAKSS